MSNSFEEVESLEITAIGDPVLRRSAATISPADIGTPAFGQLIEKMRATMIAAPGVGLAAPQIGLGIRLAVIEDSPDRWGDLDPAILAERERTALAFTVLINPVLEQLPGAGMATFYEGCLSMPGYTAAVERARSVRVRALGTDGVPFSAVYHGWPARIVQHEVDHLDGRIYVDRADPRSLSSVENLVKRRGRPLAEVADELGFSLSRNQVTSPPPSGSPRRDADS